MRRFADLEMPLAELTLCANRRHLPFSNNARNVAHRDTGGGVVHNIKRGHLLPVDLGTTCGQLTPKRYIVQTRKLRLPRVKREYWFAYGVGPLSWPREAVVIRECPGLPGPAGTGHSTPGPNPLAARNR